MSKLKVKINRTHFLEWMYTDHKETAVVGVDVIADLKAFGTYTITVQDIFDTCGYINIDMIEDYENLEKELEELDGDETEEILNPGSVLDVEWVDGE